MRYRHGSALHATRVFARLSSQAAVEAGKHVFMEKPVAVDGPGYRKVLEANEVAKKKGLLVAVGHHLRHETKHTEVIQQIHDGDIGDVMYMRAYFNTGRIWVRPRQPDQTEMQYQVNNWYHFNWLSGDHIVEQHVHDLDVCNWMVNDHPIEAQSLAGRQRRDDQDYGEIYDHHAVEYHLRQRHQAVQLLPADRRLLGQLLRACSRHQRRW